MRHNFEERKQNRIDNAKRQAAKNEQLSDRLYTTAREMGSQIPLGQPILVGHHSEKRDRNYREKIHNTYGKSVKAQEKAEYYAEKAKTIELNDAISSDDPQALPKLKGRLTKLKALQEFMKGANRCIKKQDKDAFLKLPGATEQLWQQVNTPDGIYGRGFPHFKLTNNNAKIKRIQGRITHLEVHQQGDALDLTIGEVRILENREANRVQIIFPGKPDEAIRKQLKSHGFRWSPSQGAWQRQISNTAFHYAKKIVQACTEQE